MRGYRGFTLNNEIPTIFDRLISAVSYLSMGMVGFIWLVFSMVMGKPPKYFVRFHIYQSIFVSILLYVANMLFSIMLGLIKIIPFIGSVVLFFEYYIFQNPIIFGYSLIECAVLLLIIYLTGSALLGKYGELPWVSENIKKMV